MGVTTERSEGFRGRRRVVEGERGRTIEADHVREQRELALRLALEGRALIENQAAADQHKLHHRQAEHHRDDLPADTDTEPVQQGNHGYLLARSSRRELTTRPARCAADWLISKRMRPWTSIRLIMPPRVRKPGVSPTVNIPCSGATSCASAPAATNSMWHCAARACAPCSRRRITISRPSTRSPAICV